MLITCCRCVSDTCFSLNEAIFSLNELIFSHNVVNKQSDMQPAKSVHFTLVIGQQNRACRNWASLSSSEVTFMPEGARSASSGLANAQRGGDIAAAVLQPGHLLSSYALLSFGQMDVCCQACTYHQTAAQGLLH